MNKILSKILIIIIIVVVGISAYFIGRKSAYISLQAREEMITSCQCFYATIEAVKNDSIIVMGEDINEVAFRGDFVIRLTADVEIEWRRTSLSLSELKKGNRISVYFNGIVRETAPAEIRDVFKIQLLDDMNETGV